MSIEAILVDVQAIPRLVITFLLEQPFASGRPRVSVQLCAPKYRIHNTGRLSDVEEMATVLTELLTNLKDTKTYSLWGLDDYRVEGPLLICKFAGDGLGHFTVDVTMAEETLKLSDRFVTDQTCLAAFAAELQTLGNC